MVRTLLHKLLEYSFEQTVDPGQTVLIASQLRTQLIELNLVTKELKHLESLIIKYGQGILIYIYK